MLIIDDKITWIKFYVSYLDIGECKFLNSSPFSICICVCENGGNCKKMAGREIFTVLPRVHQKYQLYLQNPNIPKEEVWKKVNNFHESVTLSRPASPLCIRWYFTLQSIIKHQQIEKARP